MRHKFTSPVKVCTKPRPVYLVSVFCRFPGEFLHIFPNIVEISSNSVSFGSSVINTSAILWSFLITSLFLDRTFIIFHIVLTFWTNVIVPSTSCWSSPGCTFNACRVSSEKILRQVEKFCLSTGFGLTATSLRLERPWIPLVVLVVISSSW